MSVSDLHVLSINADTGAENDDFITNDGTLTVTVRYDRNSGGSANENTIKLFISGGVFGAGTQIDSRQIFSSGNNDTYTVAIPGTVADGTYSLYVTRGDAPSTPLDTQALIIDKVAPGAPVITKAVDNVDALTGDLLDGNLTNDQTPTYHGTGVVGSTITLYEGATARGTGTVAGDGTWSITTSFAVGRVAYPDRQGERRRRQRQRFVQQLHARHRHHEPDGHGHDLVRHGRRGHLHRHDQRQRRQRRRHPDAARHVCERPGWRFHRRLRRRQLPRLHDLRCRQHLDLHDADPVGRRPRP
jgi:hypothetical protein